MPDDLLPESGVTDIAEQALEAHADEFSEDDEATEESFDHDPESTDEGMVDDGGEPEPDEEAVADDVEQNEEDDGIVRWSGDPKDLPDTGAVSVEDVKAYTENLWKKHTERSQLLADDRRRLDVERAEFQQKRSELEAQARVVNDPEPRDPGPDATHDQFVQWQKDHMAWTVRNEQREAVKRGDMPDPHRQQQQIDQYEQQAKVQEVYAYVKSLDGYDEKIDSEMGRMLQEDPFWSQAPLTKEAAGELFNVVKGRMEVEGLKSEAAKKETNQVRRKAKAARNAVSRPGGSKPTGVQNVSKEMSDDDLAALAIRMSAEAGD